MTPSDETLAFQASRLNDHAAFEVLVARHHARIRFLQRRFTRHEATADDLCQETFMTAWQKLASFTGQGSFAGWLSRIAYTEFLQFKRRQGRRPLEVEGIADAPASNPSPDTGPDLERLLGIVERHEALMLILSYGQGLTIDEIGELLQVPAGSVKSKIHRAKARIRKHFKLAEAP
ncbi:MAG: RNA polymerase sigma factor [Proteobacteria bacterium]|nr:RNA polymerase sigma factor [Pseudomonadota bacterium]